MPLVWLKNFSREPSGVGGPASAVAPSGSGGRLSRLRGRRHVDIGANIRFAQVNFVLCGSPFLKCMLAGRPYRLAMALPRECYYFAYLMLLGYALVFSLLLLPTALQNWLPFFFVLFLTLTPACGPCPPMFISGLGCMRPMGTCGVRCARAISISQTQNRARRSGIIKIIESWCCGPAMQYPLVGL